MSRCYSVRSRMSERTSRALAVEAGSSAAQYARSLAGANGTERLKGIDDGRRQTLAAASRLDRWGRICGNSVLQARARIMYLYLMTPLFLARRGALASATTTFMGDSDLPLLCGALHMRSGPRRVCELLDVAASRASSEKCINPPNFSLQTKQTKTIVQPCCSLG